MAADSDRLTRAGYLADPSYAQKRDGKTPVQMDIEIKHAQALALIEIGYSLRRIEEHLRRR